MIKEKSSEKNRVPTEPWCPRHRSSCTTNSPHELWWCNCHHQWTWTCNNTPLHQKPELTLGFVLPVAHSTGERIAMCIWHYTNYPAEQIAALQPLFSVDSPHSLYSLPSAGRFFFFHAFSFSRLSYSYSQTVHNLFRSIYLAYQHALCSAMNSFIEFILFCVLVSVCSYMWVYTSVYGCMH